jgi:hypothetical protein
VTVPPVPPDLGAPSTSRLLRSLALTAFGAAAIVVTIVLPAERGVDPTGIGAMIGLKEMGEIKVALAKEALADSIDEAGPRLSAYRAEAGSMFDSLQVTLAPGAGHEVKLVMNAGANVRYLWSAVPGPVNFDRHADSPTTKYHGYAKGTAVASDSGTLVAAFDGLHGWFWRNRGRDTVVVTLRVAGHFTEVKHVSP